jgi:hypothetical protein
MLVLALTMVTGVAHAANAANPCAADIAKLCKDVPVGTGKVQACLKEHEKELSGECAAWFGTFRRATGNLAATCRQDISRFCQKITPGQGRVRECLDKNRDQLSPTCRDQLGPAKPK